MTRPFDLIAIGASAGGVNAIQNIAAELPESLMTPIAIVQHIRAVPRVDITKVYRVPPGFRVVEVEDKMPIENRTLYMAPPEYHLLVERTGSFCLSQDEAVHFSRPSIDVFFESVANAFGKRALGILLTGANADGAAGLATLHSSGATTIVQKPSDAEFATMPESALKLFKPDYVLSLAAIRSFLFDLGGRA